MTPVLEASGVALEGRLHPTDLQLARGSLTAVIGPNGGGKTSLLRALARVDEPAGLVWVGREELGRVPPPRRPHLLTFLPASRDVPWPIAARDVIALGLPGPDEQRVEEVVRLLGLEELASRTIDRLSTGERARVLLGRALAPKPQVLLLDEPLSNLDPYWALRTLKLLADLARLGTGLLVSLHDLGLLDRFDRALLVNQGAIAADGPPANIMAQPVFGEVFGVEPSGRGWQLRNA